MANFLKEVSGVPRGVAIADSDLPTITLTSDVTGSGSGGSISTTVAKIQGKTVSGTTGTGNVVFSANAALTGTVTGVSSTWSGTLGILGGGAVSSQGIDMNGTLTGNSAQFGILATLTFDSTATVKGEGFHTNLATAAASFIMPVATDYVAGAMTIGSGSTVTNHVGFLGETSGGTNVAQFSDNTSFTGSYFINQSGTAASVLGGAATFNGTATFNSATSFAATSGTALTVGSSSVAEPNILVNSSAASTTGAGGWIKFSQNATNNFSVGKVQGLIGATTNVVDDVVLSNNILYLYSGGAQALKLAANQQITVTTTNWGTGGTAIGESAGVLTTSPSSQRYKENINPLSQEVDTSKIYDLNAVTFDYKKDGKHSFGYIAEEVHKVLPCLVHIENDRPESVSYAHVAVLLVEEIKKLRERIEALEAK